MSRFAYLLTLPLALAACADELLLAEEEAEVGSSDQAIIGGATDNGDPAVVMYSGFCTGTLISPRVVLTAAHCVEGGNSSYVAFGTSTPWSSRVDIVDTVMHRLYDPPAFLQWDIALARLAEPVTDVTPIPYNVAELGPADIGIPVRTIGFGVTDGETQDGFGIKRQVQLTLDEVDYYHIGVGTPTQNSCQGDSGGPTLARIDDREQVVGVTSFGSNACMDRSYMTRVDSMQDFIDQVVGAWDGPCQLDGECVTEGCAVTDPDCDETQCGFDGYCGIDCEEVDLDCPVGGRAGDLCEDKYDCETRACVVAADDERLSFCTTTCDPARPLETCPAPLSTCVEGADGPYCAYNGPTVSAQGWPCQDGSECRSGMCDASNDICVESCGDDLPECPEPYSCEDVGGNQVCTVGSDDGGGCGCRAGSGAGLPAAFALFLFGIAAWRRRRP